MFETNKINNKIKKIAILTACLVVLPIITSAKSTYSGYFTQSTIDGAVWFTDIKNQAHSLNQNKFNTIKKMAIGISSANIKKIPIGIIPGLDTDKDGLPDNLEIAIHTNPQKTDSDKDGNSDGQEIKNNYNPLGKGKLPIDKKFAAKQVGKLFVQVEDKWQTWYINPTNSKRYLITSESDVGWLVKNYGHTIISTVTTSTSIIKTSDEVMQSAAEAIRKNNVASATELFIPEMNNSIKYTLKYLSSESRLMLGNLLSGSILSSSKPNEKIYTNEIYFSNKKYKVNFHVKNLIDGSWKIENL